MIVITGCDSGIGKELYAQYESGGSALLGTTIEKKRTGTLHYCDYLSRDSIFSFIQAIQNLHNSGDKLEKLFLNAGRADACPIEHLDEKSFREIMEINFFGNLLLLKELLPIIREDKTRVVLISSSAGRIAPPFFSPYACSKFALEALGDCLRREVGPLGVPVIIFEPRSIATPIWEHTWNKALESSIPLCNEVYRESMRTGGEKLVTSAGKGMSAYSASLLIKKLSEKRKPKARYIIARNRLLTWILYHVPSSLADAVFKRLFRS